MEQKFSRRSALALVAATGLASAVSVGQAAAELDIEKTEPQWFRDRIGDRFIFQTNDEPEPCRMEVELIDVAAKPRTGRRAKPFSLLFREVEGGSDSNACYAMAHVDAALPTVFVGRVLDAAQGAYHEVIFN